MTHTIPLVYLVVFLSLLPCASLAEVMPGDSIELSGSVKKAKDISALAFIGSHLIIGSDETSFVQVLERKQNGYAVPSDDGRISIILPGSPFVDVKEVDIEGIAVDRRTVYVIGSHARVRPAGDTDTELYSINRAHLDESPGVSENKQKFGARNIVAKFELDDTGVASNLQNSSLLDLLNSIYPFKLFRDIPSKENGVDIEGLAVRNGKLYAGFRGPVLRGNFVPILEFDFRDPLAQHRVLYVKLAGRGVRDMVAVSNGFLILAGPLGDGKSSYQIYFWNGEDVVCGKDRPDASKALVLLGEVPMISSDGKAEGLTVIGEVDSTYKVVLAFDGIENGGLRMYSVTQHGAIPSSCD